MEGEIEIEFIWKDVKNESRKMNGYGDWRWGKTKKSKAF